MDHPNPYDARNYFRGDSAPDVPKSTLVANRLRSDILTGILRPGVRVPMAAIAAELSVSVQPVREALQLLEGEGLVEMTPNKGARVRHLDRQSLIHTHEIGAALECYLTRQFAEDAPPSALRRIAELQADHDAAVAALDWAAIDRSNFVFHRYINIHGGNTAAGDIVSRHYGLSHGLLTRAGRSPEFANRVRSDHHALIDAFRAHDVEAASRISHEHLRASLESILEAFDRETGPK